MKAERERLDPANRSILFSTSVDSVIDVFSFILPLYYQSMSGCTFSAVVVFEVMPENRMKFVWGGTGREAAQSEDDLRKVISPGRLRDDCACLW